MSKEEVLGAFLLANIPEIISQEEFNDVKESIKELLAENQELKKQLENCYCNRTDCSSRIKDSKKYDSLVQKVESQQKEFIMWLENEINRLNDYCYDEQSVLYSMALYELQKTREILSKYKEVIGVKDE